MPDWSYRTLLRPALFTLSPERARDLTLGVTATLATLPGGALLIETFGDLAPPPALSTVLAGVSVRSPIGAGPALPRRIGDTILAARSTTTNSSTQDDLTTSTQRTVLVRDGQRGAGGHPCRFLAFCGGRWWHGDWPWAALLGTGMVVAGTLAWLVAIVRVVLPYDETFLGLSRAQVAQANWHLLSLYGP